MFSEQSVSLANVKYDVLILVYSLETFCFHDVSYLDPHLNHSLQRTETLRKSVI